MVKVLLEDCCEILDSMRVPITSSDRTVGPYPYYGANGIQDHVANYIFDDELVLLAEDGGNFGSKERPIAYRVSGKCWVNNHAHVLKPKDGLDVDYLCYSLMFYDVGGMVNGATRKKLTQAAMRQMMIPKRSMEEQRRIVDILAKVVAVKEKRQHEIAEFDNLIKARFVEMFGDPLTNPKHIPMTTIGNVCDFIGGSQPPRKEFIFKPKEGYVRLIQIRDYKTDEYVTYAPIDHCHKFCNADDIMIGRYGPPIFQILQGLEGAYNVALMKAVPHGINKEFMRAYLKRDELLHFLEGFSARTAGQAGIAMNELRSYPCPLPSTSAQEEFVDFIQQVDKSKVAVQKSLDETQVLFNALMQKYFG